MACKLKVAKNGRKKVIYLSTICTYKIYWLKESEREKTQKDDSKKKKKYSRDEKPKFEQKTR